MKLIRILFAICCCAAFVEITVLAADCEGLTDLELKNTTIVSAQIVPEGAFTPPSKSPPQQQGAPSVFKTLPEFCRVQGVLAPSSDSHIRFEVWMPVSRWNEKYWGVGNGGYAGSISYSALADALSKNYATASTDTGHQETRDASWALEHPEKIIDFGYRAIHETTVAAKLIAGTFFDKKAQYSYFSSCSNGGRQALMEAQRFPEDFDGIIAGAPALNWTQLCSAGAYIAKTFAFPESYIAAGKLPAIQNAVIAECDLLDSVQDGIIEDPTKCRPDPSKLLCKGNETNDCLTASQATALQEIYNGISLSNGETLLFGQAPGGEAEQGGWEQWVTGKDSHTESAAYFFSTNFFQNMVYDDPSWDYRTFELDQDAKAAETKLSHILNASDPDLSKFKKRGGKLILYHGWNDAAIPASEAIDYHKRVASSMGEEETDQFLRLFLVPGMQHCGGGVGTDSFNSGDADHNISVALQRWVEEDVPPNKIIATKYHDNGEVVRTRPLCPYPMTSSYKGSGSTDDAANFVCTEDE